MRCCNICRLTSEKSFQLGRVVICDDCLESIKECSKYQDSTEFQMIFHADMSLRIFRKTFPEIYELEQFPTQLKSLRRNIDNLEKKVDLLPPEATILPPLKNIINELNVLHTVYNSYTTPNTDTLEA